MENVIGQKIKALRPMTSEEMDTQGWDEDNLRVNTIVIELENGAKLFPMRDAEGNGGGILGLTYKGKEYLMG